MQPVIILGAGIAGSEVAWQLSIRGIPVRLFEMKPQRFSPAHNNPDFAELVCSNSLRSIEETSAPGILKRELEACGSLIMEAALRTRIPAGKALAVDRTRFSQFITAKIQDQRNITVIREEVSRVPRNTLSIVATGPLTSDLLARDIQSLTGESELYFYDAISPIISADSINTAKMFEANRWDREGSEKGDYLNIPLTEQDYLSFVNDLVHSRTLPLRNFESAIHFEGCLPIEELARRGEKTLSFGPLKPVGLIDPTTGRRPFAVVQLRSENRDRTSFNMVGFQTRLIYEDQKQVFRRLPGLNVAEFERLGSMHRNTFLNAPRLLTGEGNLRLNPQIFFAGQITGVEGYIESAASGLMTGLIIQNLLLKGTSLKLPPPSTALGALFLWLRSEPSRFSPSNINFSLFQRVPSNPKMKKRDRKMLYSSRARNEFLKWLIDNELRHAPPMN